MKEKTSAELMISSSFRVTTLVVAYVVYTVLVNVVGLEEFAIIAFIGYIAVWVAVGNAWNLDRKTRGIRGGSSRTVYGALIVSVAALIIWSLLAFGLHLKLPTLLIGEAGIFLLAQMRSETVLLKMMAERTG